MNPVQSQTARSRSVRSPEISGALAELRTWVEQFDYAGYEPYDILTSPCLTGVWKHSVVTSGALIQLGRRFAGERIRKSLNVPPSKNPKALGLFLAGYCDQIRCGADFTDRIAYLQSELKRLASPNENDYCWGYDWNFISVRGSVLKAYAPNAIATVFCAEALLDSAELLGDSETAEMALSAARFCITRLNRSFRFPEEICFSYTPENHTL